MTVDPFAPKTETNDPFAAPAVETKKETHVTNVVGSPEGKITATLKQHGGFDAAWIVVHGATASEVKETLRDILNEDLLNAVAVTAKTFGETKEGNTAPPAPPQRSNYRQNNRPQGGGGNQAEGDFGPTQTCQHGEKRVIEGKYGPFWACPADRDDPSKCKPQKAYKQ